LSIITTISFGFLWAPYRAIRSYCLSTSILYAIVDVCLPASAFSSSLEY